jgi:hypothetical protein
MFHPVGSNRSIASVGLKGGILRVALASVAVRLLLKLGGRAPGCGWVCPALGGLLAIVGSCRWRDCRVTAAWLWDCRRWPLALVCLSASGSGFGEAGLWDPPSESGVASF